MPIILINEQEDLASVGLFDVLALVGWVIGFVIEVSADVEKFVFRCNTANKDKFITQGVWSYSRHPNYFGEILMWVCIALSVSTTSFSNWILMFSWLSPAFTAFLLLKVSGVPMVEAAG